MSAPKRNANYPEILSLALNSSTQYIFELSPLRRRCACIVLRKQNTLAPSQLRAQGTGMGLAGAGSSSAGMGRHLLQFVHLPSKHSPTLCCESYRSVAPRSLPRPDLRGGSPDSSRLHTVPPSPYHRLVQGRHVTASGQSFSDILLFAPESSCRNHL